MKIEIISLIGSIYSLMQLPIPTNIPVQIVPPTRKSHPRKKFSQDEDNRLKYLVCLYGENWETVSHFMRTRNPRQCRERWTNYLSGKKTQAPWTQYEDEKLKELYQKYGPKWVKISSHFPNRSDVSIKNRWNVFVRQEKRQHIFDLLKKPQNLSEDTGNESIPSDDSQPFNIFSNPSNMEQALFSENFLDYELSRSFNFFGTE